MKFKTYSNMILFEGRNEDEFNTQGNTEKTPNLNSFPIFICQQESSVNLYSAWHISWGQIFVHKMFGTNSL